MKVAYKAGANTRYLSAYQSPNSCDYEMHDFLLSAIDQANKSKSNEIGKPAGLFEFQFSSLTRIKLTN